MFGIVSGKTATEVFRQKNDSVPVLGCLLWHMIRIHTELAVPTLLVRKDVG